VISKRGKEDLVQYDPIFPKRALGAVFGMESESGPDDGATFETV
jgi:hypothetical protein